MNRQKRFVTMEDYAYRSPLAAWNPGLKMAVVLSALVMGIGSTGLVVSLWLIGTAGLITVLAGRVPLRNYLRLLRIPLVFIILGCAAIAVEIRTDGAFSAVVTASSVRAAATVAARAFGAVSVLYLLTLSTPVGDLIGVLKKLHMPDILTELMYLIYRYIFVLAETERTVSMAAEARLGYCDFKTSCRTFGSSMGILLGRSLKQAGDSYDAMLSRCYCGELRFLEEKKPVRVRQAAASLLYLLCTLILWTASVF